MEKINKVEKITHDLIRIFELSTNDNIYSLELNNNNIGYGIIRDNNDNKLEVYILKKYQGNGYGTKLFKELLKIINEKIIVKTKIENIIMRRIIEKCNGIEKSRDGNFIIYVVPKSKRSD